MDHRGGDAGALAAIAPVDVLDDLLTPLVLEIHVDVRRLAAFGGHEPLEQQSDLRRIDGGDVQAIAHGGICRRTTPLAEDVATDGVAHDVVHRQEIPRVVELRDDAQLLLDGVAYLRRNSPGITHRRALPGQVGEMLVRCQPGRDRFVRVLIGQFGKRKITALHDVLGAQDRLGIVAEQPGDLPRRLQMAFGIGLQREPGLVDTTAQSDAGHHILQWPPVRQVIEDVVGCHHRYREFRQRAQTAGVVATIATAGCDMRPTAEIHFQAIEKCPKAIIQPVGRNDDQRLSFTMLQQIGVVQKAAVGDLRGLAGVAMRHPPLADGEQPRQSSPRRAILRIAEQVRRGVAERQARADHETETDLLRRIPHPHHAGHAVEVGDADGGQPQHRRGRREFFRRRGAAQERECARHLQFGVLHGIQPNSPCRYHCGIRSGACRPARKIQNLAPSESSTR